MAAPRRTATAVVLNIILTVDCRGRDVALELADEAERLRKQLFMQEVLHGIYTSLLRSVIASGFLDSGNSQPLTAENPSDPCLGVSRGGSYKV